MKEKDCKIVQDLLPNYIEKLTNEETNKYIEEHLSECDNCKNVYENMKKELQLSENKKDNREVRYIKKYNKKLKFLKAIILSIVAIYVLIIARRMIILYTLADKEKKSFIYTNYHSKVYSYSTGKLMTYEGYYKDENYLVTITYGNNKHIMYNKDNDYVRIIEKPKKRYMTTDKDTIIFARKETEPIQLENIISIHFTTIRSGYCNGKECYIFDNLIENTEHYYDKETGICIRNVWKSSKKTGDTDSRIDYEYTFNVVKDSDIVKPEIYGNEEELKK